MALFDRHITRNRNPSRSRNRSVVRSTRSGSSKACLVFVDGAPILVQGNKSWPAFITDKKFVNGQYIYLVVGPEQKEWMGICGKHATQLYSNPDTTAPHLDPIPATTVPEILEDPAPEGCCYDAVQGIILCADGQPPHGLAPELVNQGTDSNGNPYVVVIHPDLNNGNRLVMPLCPDQPPIECCYDAAAGVLRCPGNANFDGLEVSLAHMTDVMQDGKIYAAVTHPNLPNGVGQFPLCDDEVPEGCCYDGDKKILVCPGDAELDGKTAGVVTQFTGPDGRPWVSVSWDGGGARMPLCGTECPPSYCCVNIQTGTFVCPGEPSLNNQPANVVSVETDGSGYNFAVLSDGSKVPVCGAECPPPELCPTCPTCPPGMWMSPDKECVMPSSLPCPDGGGDFPGEVPTPPEGTPWWHEAGHCCEDCALGLTCDEGREGNPTTAQMERCHKGCKANGGGTAACYDLCRIRQTTLQSNPPPELPIATPCSEAQIKQGCYTMDKGGCWCPTSAAPWYPVAYKPYPSPGSSRPFVAIKGVGKLAPKTGTLVLPFGGGKIPVRILKLKAVNGRYYAQIRAISRTGAWR